MIIKMHDLEMLFISQRNKINTNNKVCFIKKNGIRMTVIDYNRFFLASVHQHEGQSKSPTQPLHDYSKYVKPKSNKKQNKHKQKNF